MKRRVAGSSTTKTRQGRRVRAGVELAQMLADWGASFADWPGTMATCAIGSPRGTRWSLGKSSWTTKKSRANWTGQKALRAGRSLCLEGGRPSQLQL